MRFAILGPLDVTDDDGAHVLISRRLHRAALAVLLLNPGQPRSVRELSAALWGDQPPLSPETSLRTCVYGIRKLLPDSGRLRTHSSGYLIDVAAGELDAAEFTTLASQGRQELDLDNPGQAEEFYTRALGLWREPPVADLPAVPGKDRLLEQRLQAQDALIDARLALGRHRQVLPELRSLVANDPLREHACAQLMIALYRCGARADALAAFGRTRLCLVRAYGIEPGPELQDLHGRLLADDPGLTIPARSIPAAWRPACQLPAPLADFTGRAAELSGLLARMTGAGMAVSVVSGMPGIGKTALALRAAHLARPSFPDGQLYACLDDGGRPRDPFAVLGELLRGLGVPPTRIPDNSFEREALYRSVLAGRRVLVLADGASSAAQVRPLTPGTAGCAVVVTSRARLADIDGARLIELDVLPPGDSIDLLATVSGRQLTKLASPIGDAGDPERATESAGALAAGCGHLPLALRIAGARLADDQDLTVARLAGLLADEDDCLDQLTVGDESLQARFSASAQCLGEAARTTLALLGMAGPGELCGSMIDLLRGDPADRGVAAELANAGMLFRVRGGGGVATYRVHPLVRAYARRLLEQADPGLVGSATGGLLAAGWLELAGGGCLPQLDRAGLHRAAAGPRRG